MNTKESNRTPGPWRVQPAGTAEVIGADGTLVTSCLTGDANCKLDLSRVQSNALLVAAAPELLNALTEMFAESEKAMAMLNMPMLSAEWHEKARVAIAAALGPNAVLSGKPPHTEL